MKKIISIIFFIFLAQIAFADEFKEIHCENNKCGLFKSKSSDKLLLPLEYDKIEVLFQNKYYKAKKDGKWELFEIKKKAKKLSDATYDEIFYYNYYTFFVKNQGNWNLLNIKENLSEPISLNFTDTASNLFIAENNGKYGLYHIEYVYDSKHNNDYYSKHGYKKELLKFNQILPFEYDSLEFSYGNMQNINFIAKKDNNYKIIEVDARGSNRKSKVIFDMDCSNITHAPDQMIYIVNVNGKNLYFYNTYDYNKKTLKAVTKYVENNNKKPAPKLNLTPKQGYIIEENNKFGYQNKKGEIKLEPIYDKVYASKKYAPNYLIVKKGDKYAIYKISSNKLTNFKYDLAYINSNTQLVAYEGENKKIYDKKGYLRVINKGVMTVPATILALPGGLLFIFTWPIAIADPDYGNFIDTLLSPLNMIPITPCYKEFP